MPNPRALERCVFDLKRRVRTRLARSPRLFPLLVRGQRNRLACLFATAHSEIVIDGPPRSANTFSVHAFRTVNPAVRIAHHMHAPAHVLLGVRLGLPVIVVLRAPRDAVLSEVVREPRKTIRRALNEWISFYETVEPALDSIVVAEFHVVTSNYAVVIDAVNERFGTSFIPYHNDAELDARTFASIERGARARGKTGLRLESQVPRPSPVRALLRAEVEVALSDPRLAPTLRRAEGLYQRFARHAPRPDPSCDRS